MLYWYQFGVKLTPIKYQPNTSIRCTGKRGSITLKTVPVHAPAIRQNAPDSHVLIPKNRA